MDQNSAPVYLKPSFFFCQRSKSSSKVCLGWIFFFMMTSIVELNNRMYNIRLRSSKLIIKSDAQKQMVESSFVRRFHDLQCLEVKPLFHFI